MNFLADQHPHRRQNPLTGEWVLVSPHRTQRPWQGQLEASSTAALPAYDPECYLCPGNQRAGNRRNPDYEDVFVFTNDFAALKPETVESPKLVHHLLRMEPISGTCRVICFSPRHDLTLPEIPLAGMVRVIETWIEQVTELGQTYPWVQVFENKGAAMGSSNPHPHGQIWASEGIPTLVKKEGLQQRAYYAEHQQPLLVEYAQLESELEERIVAQNEDWLAVVPYWAVWPFEILLMPRRHVLRLPDLTDAEQHNLAVIMQELLTRYDNLFQTSFPYSMGWHGAPFMEGDQDHWQLHAHFYPPLLRSATVRKFLVGYEMLAEAQRDLTAEQAAERLRAVPAIHYKQAKVEAL